MGGWYVAVTIQPSFPRLLTLDTPSRGPSCFVHHRQPWVATHRLLTADDLDVSAPDADVEPFEAALTEPLPAEQPQPSTYALALQSCVPGFIFERCMLTSTHIAGSQSRPWQQLQQPHQSQLLHPVSPQSKKARYVPPKLQYARPVLPGCCGLFRFTAAGGQAFVRGNDGWPGCCWCSKRIRAFAHPSTQLQTAS